MGLALPLTSVDEWQQTVLLLSPWISKFMSRMEIQFYVEGP